MKKRKAVVSLMVISLMTTSSIMSIPNCSMAEKDSEKEVQKAYVKGYQDGRFGPDRSITRAESTQIVVSSMDQDYDDSVNYENNFSDVKEGWYKNIIGYAQGKEIIEGYEDGSFGPDKSITRAEFVTIVAKINGFENNKKTTFHDIEGHWAKEYIAFAESKGWVDGYGDGEFRPESKITRAEVTKIINSITDRKVDEKLFEEDKDNLITFSDLEKEHWAYKHIISAANTVEDKTEYSDSQVDSNEQDTNDEINKPETPDTPNTPGKSEEPSAPDNPDVTNDSEDPNIPAVPENPSTPEIPDLPGETENSNEPAVPEKPSEPEVPDSLNDSEDSNNPSKPEKPEESGSSEENEDAWDTSDFIIEYEKGYEGLTINGFSNKGKEKFKNNKKIEFPGEYNGEKIAAIGTASFASMGIESIKISGDINTIGLEAFRGNEIKNLELPEGIEFIAMSAFENNQIETLILPESLTVVRNKAFMNNKLNKLVLPDNIKKLHAYSFADNEIADVKLPKNLEEIEGNAFDTNKIERVYVPDSLIILDRDSFYNNPGIIRMGEYSSRVAVYTVGGKNINNLRESVNILIDAEEDQDLKPVTPADEIGNGWQYDDFSYNIIYDVVTINGFTKKGAEKAKTVKDLVLPDKDPKTGRSVTDIGEWAFKGWSLQSVKMPTGIKKINVGAFEDNHISYIEFGNELMEIQGEAFKNNNLTMVNVPVATRKIDASTFEGNPGAYKDRVAVFTANGMNNGLFDSEHQLINPKGLVDKDSVILGALEYSIKSAKELNLDEYEPAGKEEMKAVLAESEALVSKENASQEEVNNAAMRLNKAVEKLQKKPEEEIVTEDADYVSWDIENFEIEETTDYYTGIKKISIKGLTEKGIEKLKNDRVLLLPTKDSNGNTINSVSRYAFFKKSVDKVVIPGNYKYIQARSFEQTGLKELILSNGIEEINSGAFSENNLTEVTIPKTVKEDGLTYDAFDINVKIIDLRK